MKSFVSVFAFFAAVGSAFAAGPNMAPATGRGRASMSNQMMAVPRAVASKAQISAGAALTPESAVVNKSSIKADGGTLSNPDTAPDESVSKDKEQEKKDMREKEKRACLQNNIGIGNTFVWASRYSNIGNYSTMIEDIEEPDNNVCFVKVEVKSNDPKISVADVPSQYFEMGRAITCGDWANYDTLKKRILDAKKSGRTWATIGGAVGGAAVGVGAMELFGNSLIGGKVMGQKDLAKNNPEALLRSQLAVLQKENETEYNRFITELTNLKCACQDSVWTEHADKKPDECETYAYVFDMAHGCTNIK